ncbi:protein rep [Paremcibacter congregatus]|nr:protein rep [Paremcibacter congregatus]QDE27265.1 hypothetical protein FIV45_08195 [Paremcibacter congregatus]
MTNPLKGTQVELPPLFLKDNLEQLNGAQKRDRLRTVAGQILTGERVYKCGRHRIGAIVTISASSTGAMFNGVETCGSIWHCPVCAEKISNKRRLEVAAAIDGTKERRGGVYMLTLTMKHAPFDKCAALKDAVAMAWRKLQNTRAWRSIKEDRQIFGTIRALEITHGANGWHPHLHILLLTENELSEHEQEETRLEIFEQWDKKIYALTGQYCHADACDLRPTNSSEYLTKGADRKAGKMKWGADREISKANIKQGKGGKTPFELLEAAYYGNRQAAAMFAEYAAAFKGARHITWTHGLKDFFEIAEILDEKIAEISPEKVAGQDELPFSEDLNMRMIVALDRGTWAAVCRHNLRPDLLDAAYKHGRAGVVGLLAKYGLSVWLGTGHINEDQTNAQFSNDGKVIFNRVTARPPRLTEMPHSATPWKD